MLNSTLFIIYVVFDFFFSIAFYGTIFTHLPDFAVRAFLAWFSAYGSCSLTRFIVQVLGFLRYGSAR